MAGELNVGSITGLTALSVGGEDIDTKTDAAFATANVAASTANVAASTANAALPNTSTTLAGTLTITGGLTYSGITAGNNATGTRIISTGDPTGGSDGDVWFKVT